VESVNLRAPERRDTRSDMEEPPNTGKARRKQYNVSVSLRTRERLQQARKLTGVPMSMIVTRACSKEIAAGSAILRARFTA
jgi:hypothetical protein